MMILKLALLLALCSTALAYSYCISAKKVYHNYYNTYDYVYPSYYPTYGHLGNRCHTLHHTYGAYGVCKAYTYGYGFGHAYNTCGWDYCYADLYYGKSPCHGYVKLSKVYKYSYAKQCSSYGFCNYSGYSYGHYGYCSCHTKVCTTSIRACYEYGGQYYEDDVTVQVPCGCGCYQKTYKPKRYFPYFGIAFVIKGKHY